MQVLGNNDRLGSNKVNLSGNRHVLAASEKTERFPRGVLGLLPVVTTRRGGTKDVLYAFKDEADDQALVDAAFAVNDVLHEAASRMGRTFLVIDGIQIGVTAQGWGFTRAEYTPYDKRGNASEVPMRLYLETSTESGARRTVSATVDYDTRGRILRVGAREYGDHGNYDEVIATFPEGRLTLEKIESVTASSGHTRLVYKRRG